MFYSFYEVKISGQMKVKNDKFDPVVKVQDTFLCSLRA
jgi:hypothetical protein